MTEPDLLPPHIAQLAWYIWRDLSWANNAGKRDWNWVVTPDTMRRLKKYQWHEPTSPLSLDVNNPGRFLFFGIPIETDPETPHEIELRIRR